MVLRYNLPKRPCCTRHASTLSGVTRQAASEKEARYRGSLADTLASVALHCAIMEVQVRPILSNRRVCYLICGPTVRVRGLEPPQRPLGSPQKFPQGTSSETIFGGTPKMVSNVPSSQGFAFRCVSPPPFQEWPEYGWRT